MVELKRWMLWILVGVALSSIAMQGWQLFKFVYAGPRFTAADGKALCERVRELEKLSYGFQDFKREQAPCDYENR